MESCCFHSDTVMASLLQASSEIFLKWHLIMFLLCSNHLVIFYDLQEKRIYCFVLKSRIPDLTPSSFYFKGTHSYSFQISHFPLTGYFVLFVSPTWNTCPRTLPYWLPHFILVPAQMSPTQMFLHSTYCTNHYFTYVLFSLYFLFSTLTYSL